MSVKEALDYLISQLYNKSSCGRLTEKEKAAIKVLRLKIGNEPR